eukprot:1144641-Ditylum_brightwellii.AAC.1
MVASVDVKNGYNEIMRSAILEAIWDFPDVHSYIGLGYSAHLTSADFTCSKGVQQGAVEASFLFCVGSNKAN